MKEQMNIVIVGHVDHGKSTIIGRLLADTHSLPEGKLEQVRTNCQRNSKPFEYAFLLDALKDEQAQGITIDAARVFFRTNKRHYIIIDAPGHIEFLKNMITGASRAEAALLVIDADEGIKENSRRHGYMLSMLGVKQVVVLVNKMDLVEYDKSVYDNIVSECSEFLKDIDIVPACFIPVSGLQGDNIADVSSNMPWAEKGTVLEVLDRFTKEAELADQPFRMPVQDVYRFTGSDDDQRIIAGSVEAGTIHVGDEVIFFPSGKKSRVASIEGFNQKTKKSVSAGYSTGFTLEEQLYITRGELAVKASELKSKVSSRMKVSIFWLGRNPMIKKKDYTLKLGTARITAKLEKIIRVIDTSNLKSNETYDRIGRHEVAECILKLKNPIAFDTAEDIAATSRFVIVDDYEIRGGGIVRETLDDRHSVLRQKVFLRNYKWVKSNISNMRRAQRYNQKPSLLIITGEKGSGRKEIARKLEEELFNEGKYVYYIGLGSVLYGVDADIKGKNNLRVEHIRRFAEVSHILLDSGVILIITARSLSQDDLEVIKTCVNPDVIETVWVGDSVTTDIAYDIKIERMLSVPESVVFIKELLQEKGVIFSVW